MDDITSEKQALEGAPNKERHGMVPNYDGAEAANDKCGAACCEQDCLKMFMRAWHGDAKAQVWFQRHFRGVLLDWFMQHPGREAACRLYSEDYYIDRAFQCAWRIPLDQPPFEFNTLATVIRCLYANLHGLIVDVQRKSVSARVLSARESHSTAALCNQTEIQKIWSNVQECLSNERERRLANLLFFCGLKPKEVIDSYPQEFSNMREISRLRLAIMEQICNMQQI